MPIFLVYSLIEKIAALALSVSKTVSTRRISTPPGKGSYEPIEDIVLKADEKHYLRGLFHEYKRELTKN